MTIQYSFICNACKNYATDKCKNCRGKGNEWVPINREAYEKDPNEYIKNLILTSS